MLGIERLANVGAATLAVVGLWMVIAPSIIDVENGMLRTGTVRSGVITAALSAYAASATDKADTAGYTSVRPYISEISLKFRRTFHYRFDAILLWRKRD